MKERRFVGTVAMLLGLAVLSLPWTLVTRVPDSMGEVALVASGLALSVFGTALVFSAGAARRRPRRAGTVRRDRREGTIREA